MDGRIQGGGIIDLLWQLTTGHSLKLNPTMWYQVVLIFITIGIMATCYFFPRKIAESVLIICGVGALILQYTGINYAVFSNMRYELRYPLGRICEMIPLAVIGFELANHNIFAMLEKQKHVVIGILGILIWKLEDLKEIVVPKGFGYAGVNAILVSCGLLAVAVLFPMDKIGNKGKKIIAMLSKYTLGIYCMHRLIMISLFSLMDNRGIQTGTFGMCIFIYIICYIVAYMMEKIPVKLIQGLVV